MKERIAKLVCASYSIVVVNKIDVALRKYSEN